MEMSESAVFDRDLSCLSPGVRQAWYAAAELFGENSYHPSLNNHELQNEFRGKRSIDITDDYRAVYVPGKNRATFVRIGTHEELYG
jgi:mRNA-degrading endonuclease YafQ of YafQ-DinJ toxin-antitoxin module